MCAYAFLQAQSGPVVCFENCRITLQIKAEKRWPARSTSNCECASVLTHRQEQEQEQQQELERELLVSASGSTGYKESLLSLYFKIFKET